MNVLKISMKNVKCMIVYIIRKKHRFTETNVFRGSDIGTEPFQWYSSYVLASIVVDIELETLYQRFQLQSN